MSWTWDLDIEGLRTFEEVKALLRDFETVDSGSYAFRYPVDTKGRSSIPQSFTVHMPTFYKHMDALLEALEAAVMGLEAIKNNTFDALYYAQDDSEEDDAEESGGESD